MPDQDIRWKQRFANYTKAFLFLQEAVAQQHYSPLEAGGLVQAFEFTFELGWKTLKDYLESQGMDPKYPRDTIKEGFRTQLLEDGHTWIHMLEKRNELAHTYNQEVARHAVEIIRNRYFPALRQLYQTLHPHADNS